MPVVGQHLGPSAGSASSGGRWRPAASHPQAACHNPTRSWDPHADDLYHRGAACSSVLPLAPPPVLRCRLLFPHACYAWVRSLPHDHSLASGPCHPGSALPGWGRRGRCLLRPLRRYPIWLPDHVTAMSSAWSVPRRAGVVGLGRPQTAPTARSCASWSACAPQGDYPHPAEYWYRPGPPQGCR